MANQPLPSPSANKHTAHPPSAQSHPPLQLCKAFNSGKMDRSEYDVNIECGFVKRTHAPLVPATATVAV